MDALHWTHYCKGITGATGAVCASAMTDVTHPHERTRYFGFWVVHLVWV